MAEPALAPLGATHTPWSRGVAASFTVAVAASIAVTPCSSLPLSPSAHELPVPKLPPLGNLIQRRSFHSHPLQVGLTLRHRMHHPYFGPSVGYSIRHL